jgi:hypothetical protein
MLKIIAKYIAKRLPEGIKAFIMQYNLNVGYILSISRLKV